MQPLRHQIKTRSDMFAVLKAGNVDIERFDEVSDKSLDTLFEEVLKKEVQLIVIPAVGVRSAYVARVALTVAVRVVAPIQRVQYFETKRELRSGKTIRKRRNWTITGTCTRGMLLKDDAVREIEEELGLRVNPDELHFVTEQEIPYPYESSVYPLLKTHAMIQPVEWYTTELPWPEEVRVIKDQAKLVTIERFPFLRGPI